MTTLDVRQPAAALAIRSGQEMWDDKQRAALAVLGIKDATNADLAVFMHVCQRTGLDPFSRQIYMINRRTKEGDQWVTKQTIQVGIDGFRVIRDRVAARLGVSVEYEDTIWYDADGSPHHVWLWEHAPTACNVTVVKDGKRFPGVVRTASYAATNRQGEPIAQWKNQPDHMIEKCAEAFALRRAFPHDLGGVQLDDEMPPPEHVPAQNGRVTTAQITSRRDQRPQNASPADSRPSTPPADDETAGEAQDPGPAPDGTPGSGPAGPGPRATSGQVGILQKRWRDLGYDDADPAMREERLTWTAQLAGLDELATTSDLTQDQAARVRELLKPCKTRADVIELIHGGGNG